MMFWLCSSVTLSAAAVAAFTNDGRRAALALWVCGLGAGGIYLTLGAEALAVIQWIIATLVGISFMFYSVTFGEHGPEGGTPRTRKELVRLALAIVWGGMFTGVIWLSVRHLPGGLNVPASAEVEGSLAIGKSIVRDHLLSLELLALTLFLVLIGAGVIARPEGAEGGEA